MTRSLMYKDIVNIVRSNESKHMMILFPIVFGIMFYIQGESAGIGYLSVIFFSLLINTFNNDEQSLCYLYLKSSPVKARDIVSAKFALVILCQVFTLILVFFVSFVINVVVGMKTVDEFVMYFAVNVLSIVCVITIMYMLFIPFIFKFGVKKSIAAMFIFAFGIMFIVGLLVAKFKNIFADINFSQNSIIAIAISIGILMPLLSYIISIKVVKSKR